jgi:hypothetical protein
LANAAIAKIIEEALQNKIMTAITLNLSPELDQELRTEAARQGLEPDRYIIYTLQERLQPKSDLKSLSGAEKSEEAESIRQRSL